MSRLRTKTSMRMTKKKQKEDLTLNISHTAGMASKLCCDKLRPIPYWLYKLHGLGIEFKCEICGGASYWGRRAFEKHFQEWRHAYGMKCLRIPNTLHFRDITKISDALKCKTTLKLVH